MNPTGISLIKDRELHRIATTAIIYKRDGSETEYLITKRSPHKKAHPGKWTVPGGGLNVDDYITKPQTNGNAGWYGSVETALQREIKEEVGVKVGPLEYLLDLTFIRPDGIPVLVLSYYGEYLGGEVTIDEDTVEYAWVNIDQAKNYDLIPGIYEEIVDVSKKIK